MPFRVNMKVLHVNGEILLSAADSNLIGKDLRENGLHINVKQDFYGNISVSRRTLEEAMEICTIGNFVGEYTVGIGVEMGLIDPENTIRISGVPHAQYARMRF
ncbi:MAG: DUF424 family protein [Candidatus Thermoplasmatota archaeon]|jgi:hypothetical protein|nr:DUF424 family protein [Candidatus Thermoplasmatota archaeon]MCL5791349.1 DUF424 family protein [Candidatus Thermoplasmatota archaeon]